MMRYALIAVFTLLSACTGEWGDWMQASAPDEDHEFSCKFRDNCGKPTESKDALWGKTPDKSSKDTLWGKAPDVSAKDSLWGGGAAKDTGSVWGNAGAAKTGSVWGPAQ